MTSILQWIGSYLGWLDQITGSYIIALFLFAITIEILLLPLAIHRQKTSIKQAKLRPKEMAIQKKYAGRNDQVTRQKMQQEIMEMHQQEGFNQFGGCLTMLIQLPIILALYRIVVDPLQYVLRLSSDTISTITKYMTDVLEVSLGNRGGTIELVAKIKEIGLEGLEGLKGFTAEGLSEGAGEAAYNAIAAVFGKLPNFTIFNGAIDLGATPDVKVFNLLLLVPVITFVVYFFSMRLTRKLTYQPSAAAQGADDKAMGCSNTMMDIGMPLMSVFITFQVPAAIGVYWIFKSIIGTGKTFLLHKVMPLPVFTKEELDEAEREIGLRGKGKGRAKNDVEGGELTEGGQSVRKQGRPGSVRSLHYIDDEDFEDTRERAERAKAVQAEIEAEKKASDDQRAKKLAARATHPDAPVLKDDARPEAKKPEDFGPEGKATKEANDENAPTENH